jgi:hypothetical protein
LERKAPGLIISLQTAWEIREAALKNIFAALLRVRLIGKIITYSIANYSLAKG